MKHILIILFWFPMVLTAQNKIEGMVMEANAENKHIGLAGANVYWLNSQIGTITKENGTFSIPYSKDYNKLS